MGTERNMEEGEILGFHAVHCSIASKNLSGSDLWPFYVPEFSPAFQQ